MKSLLLVVAAFLPAAALADEEQAVPGLTPPSSTPISRSELTMAELRNNAFTNRARTFVVHPFFASSYSATDNLELKTSAFNLLLGAPTVSAEYSLLNGPDVALSIEPSVGAMWIFSQFSAGVTGRFTVRLGSSYLSASVGGNWGAALPIMNPVTGAFVTAGGYLGMLSFPVMLTWNLQTNPMTIWEVYATTDVWSVRSITPGGAVGFNWYHSFGRSFRLGLGAYIPVGVVAQDTRDVLETEMGIRLPRVMAFPLPDITLGWKF